MQDGHDFVYLLVAQRPNNSYHPKNAPDQYDPFQNWCQYFRTKNEPPKPKRAVIYPTNDCNGDYEQAH
jgi:hypothetical protein